MVGSPSVRLGSPYVEDNSASESKRLGARILPKNRDTWDILAA